MVVATSPPPNEVEQKKKRQTLERAKANHLSKQLQMRLQYAKLKVEHGWQRQNLNEVENLYFHHSHLRCARQGHGTGAVGQRPHTAVSNPGPVCTLSDTHAIPLREVDQPVSSSDGPESASSPPEHTTSTDGQSSSPPLQTRAALRPSATSMTSTSHPPSALDLSDPLILARLAQLQAQVQMPTHSLSMPRQPSVAPSTSMSQPVSASASVPITAPGIIPTTIFPSHIQPPQPVNHLHPFATYLPQSFISASGSVPFYAIPGTTTTTHTTGASSLVPAPATTTSSTTPVSTTQTPVAPTALTYDSFWSSHASSTGPTRALYRTNTGFTASATPAGNVAMLTPGGHAAVMTADGVYVGGATSRSG